MKTIVLTTDFSKESASASEFAVKIAGILKSRLLILHVYKSSFHIPTWTDLPVPSEDKAKLKSMRQLYNLRRRLREFSGKSVEIILSARDGDTIDTIKEVTGEQHVDLLVMGTAGAKSPGYTYFGSKATELILQITVPLLLVPPKAHFSQFEKMVLAADLRHPVNAAALDNVIHFCKEFGAALDVVCISEDPSDPKTLEAGQHVRNLMQSIPHTMSILSGHTATTKIIDFATDNHADLLIMLPRPHNKLLYAVLESNTQQIARQADMPVLAVV
ncbi:universal stress protein [Dyadobacter psychrotolerans]|uniref:Universal stress protein n=1 Tax=Dyadobacter psychrotolerans TaxID=2541721 RepID=A0A4R5D429_9BACT|nr:universal stress protein [Dyadobacter psychrotolerans]TDE08149.1 universal stress protein [Dyadobacter psychrotolerans]